MIGFEEFATAAERAATFADADRFYARYLAKYPSLGADGAHELAGLTSVGFDGVDYSLAVSVDPDDAHQTGIFWSAIKSQEELAFIAVKQVPLSPRAALVSLSAHFGLNPDLLFAQAIELHAYWNDHPDKTFIVPKFKKAMAYRYLAGM